jgi:hypothetical protein
MRLAINATSLQEVVLIKHLSSHIVGQIMCGHLVDLLHGVDLPRPLMLCFSHRRVRPCSQNLSGPLIP